jgi:hypothetical protein
MSFDDLFFKHFWLLLVLIHTINGIVLKFSVRKYIRTDSRLKKGYRDYLKGWFIIGNLPWLVIGVGVLTGLINNTFDGIDFTLNNVVSVVFLVTITAIWCAGVVWIYVKDGAKFLERHPGLIFSPLPFARTDLTSKQIKLRFLLLFVPFPFILIIIYFNIF